MIDLFSLAPLAHLLPEPRESETVGGQITAAAARATGLRPGPPSRSVPATFPRPSSEPAAGAFAAPP